MADDGEDKPSFRQRVRGVVGKVVQKVKEAAQLDFWARFKSSEDSREIDLPVDMAGDTIWATQAKMADLFGVDQSVIARHIKNIFEDNELEENAATHAKFASVQNEGGREVSRQVSHYNLDVILAVGYRVSSKRATEFRKWATGVLRGYIENGYALNGKRLDSDPAALQRLAQEVRALRTSEKNIYAQVREAFKLCSIDYDSNSDEARRFYANCQDRFHWAISEQTSAQIVLDRADASKVNMGMTSLGNASPSLASAQVAKNYLNEQELRSLEILGEQWLLYAEGMAQRGKAVSMLRLLGKLDEIVSVNEYAVFPGYEKLGAKRDAANEHAKRQLELWRSQNRAKLH